MGKPNELPEILQAPAPQSGALTPVLVLSVGRLVLHHGGVGIIRSLGRMGVPVYAIVDDRWTPAAVSRHLTGAFIWDTSRLEGQRFLEGMARIGKWLNRPTVVIPTSDVAAILVAEHAAALRRSFLFPKQPAILPRTLANKRELYLLCQRLGVACPPTVLPHSIDDVHRFAARATFPVVVKAAESWHLPEGARTTSIARTPKQLYAIYHAMESQRRTNLILQEYIDPARGEDWFYHGYRDVRSNCCVGFTGRKLRSYPPLAGPTTLGKAIPNEGLRQQAEALLQAISYAGISDLDFRLDRRDGQYKLLDFNPRIGAQFRLFEDRLGVDVARALYLDLTGRPIPVSSASERRIFIAEFHDLAASFVYYWLGKLTFQEWRRSLQGCRELAWFSRDDPLPFVMMCLRLLRRVAERLLRIKPASNIANGMPRCVSHFRNGFSRRSHEPGVRAEFRMSNQEAPLGVHP
jgi:predicted ATP-grasp superfamily ATP-dependent carboligase